MIVFGIYAYDINSEFGAFAAGVAVAYSAPARSRWLLVVENNYCASRRGMLYF